MAVQLLMWGGMGVASDGAMYCPQLEQTTYIMPPMHIPSASMKLGLHHAAVRQLRHPPQFQARSSLPGSGGLQDCLFYQ